MVSTLKAIKQPKKSNPLQDWYEGLPSNKKIKIRDRILLDCEISKATFYNYLLDP